MRHVFGAPLGKPGNQVGCAIAGERGHELASPNRLPQGPKHVGEPSTGRYLEIVEGLLLAVPLDCLEQRAIARCMRGPDLGQTGGSLEFAAGREAPGGLLVRHRDVLDDVSVNVHLAVLQRHRDPVVTVEHVVTETELIHLDRRDLGDTRHRLAQVAKTILVLLPAAAERWAEV
jgi:hypothetical protein